MTITTERPAQRTVNDLPLPRADWDKASACRDVDQRVFLESRRRTQADQICRTCPVRWDCLLDAVRTPDDRAVRAAMNPRQRAEWLREEGIAPAPPFDARHVKRMLDAGAKWDDIAKVYDVTADTIQKRWRRHLDGTERKPKPPRRRSPDSGRQRLPVDLDQLRTMRAAGATWDAIAKALGVSRNTAMRTLERAGQP